MFLELITGPGGEENRVALLHLQSATSAILGHLAGSDGEDGALLRFLLGGVRQEDPAGGLVLRRMSPHDDAIPKWLQFHRGSNSIKFARWCCGRGAICKSHARIQSIT